MSNRMTWGTGREPLKQSQVFDRIAAHVSQQHCCMAVTQPLPNATVSCACMAQLHKCSQATGRDM